MTNPIADDDLIHKINLLLMKAYKQEEVYWQQRSKQLWLTLGDSNTSYFHASTKSRRARNRLSVIEDTSGNGVVEDSEIIEVISSYFQDIFKSSEPNMCDIVERNLSPYISESTNAKLICI